MDSTLDTAPPTVVINRPVTGIDSLLQRLNAEQRAAARHGLDGETSGPLLVIAGAGSNDTAAAIEASKAIAKLGVTHLLHVSPMYNKPPQRGLIEHFKRVADATDLPVVVYNVPGRTGSNIEAKTTLALANVPNIVAVKEASGNIGQITEILKDGPPHFSVLSGDDELTLSVMAAGGDGMGKVDEVSKTATA